MILTLRLQIHERWWAKRLIDYVSGNMHNDVKTMLEIILCPMKYLSSIITLYCFYRKVAKAAAHADTDVVLLVWVLEKLNNYVDMS